MDSPYTPDVPPPHRPPAGIREITAWSLAVDMWFRHQPDSLMRTDCVHCKLSWPCESWRAANSIIGDALSFAGLDSGRRISGRRQAPASVSQTAADSRAGDDRAAAGDLPAYEAVRASAPLAMPAVPPVLTPTGQLRGQPVAGPVGTGPPAGRGRHSPGSGRELPTQELVLVHRNLAEGA